MTAVASERHEDRFTDVLGARRGHPDTPAAGRRAPTDPRGRLDTALRAVRAMTSAQLRDLSLEPTCSDMSREALRGKLADAGRGDEAERAMGELWTVLRETTFSARLVGHVQDLATAVAGDGDSELTVADRAFLLDAWRRAGLNF